MIILYLNTSILDLIMDYMLLLLSNERQIHDLAPYLKNGLQKVRYANIYAISNNYTK